MKKYITVVVDVVAYIAPAILTAFLFFDMITYQEHLAIDIAAIGGWLCYAYERRDCTVLKLRLLDMIKAINEVTNKNNA